jgi:hypothetical protein
MGKAWVLDTETKGTGAEMVPLEKVLRKPVPRSGRPSRAGKPSHKPRRAQPEEERRPARFKVVDAMTREVLAEGADTRTTVSLLEGIRSVVDVTIYVRDREDREWRKLPLREQKRLWGFRGR